MMKQFLISCAIAASFIFPFALIVAFKGECKHVFVAVEQPHVERRCHITAHPMLENLEIGRTWKEPIIGSHQSEHDEKDMAEGIAIVCVKCHLETKQKIHYNHK